MNDSAASGGILQRTGIMDAAHGGESNPSWQCQNPNDNSYMKNHLNLIFGTATIESGSHAP
jgi:hypothetical protein